MKPKVIDISKRIDATPAVVWALVSDSSTWPSWTPIDEYEPAGPAGPDGTGDIRIFRTGRHTVREQIIERRTEQRLSYTLLAGLPLRGYRAEIDLSATEDDRTDVRWHTTFSPKVPGTGWLYLLALRRATQAFVDGLADRAAGDPSR